MRLRVAPSFISPPPGFGGLGYTPTARACVNISIPLQLRVIDMLDVFTPLLKLFANEPLERLMYTIIIFGLTLWLGNDSNLLIVFYVQIMPDDFVMQLHRF